MDKTIGHYYLYAKGHYKKDNLIRDLRKIKSLVYIECPKTDKIIITQQLLKEVYRHINYRDDFIKFVDDLLPHNQWRGNNEYEHEDDLYLKVIKKCLVILANTKVVNIPFELPMPDSNILPIKRD